MQAMYRGVRRVLLFCKLLQSMTIYASFHIISSHFHDCVRGEPG